MLETKFPRILGDVGNPDTFDFAVKYKIIKGASPDLVVRKNANPLLQAFINAGLELVAEGASAITTSCGFLAIFQSELQQALPVPVLTSSLLQVPHVNKSLPEGKRTGILTISASSVTPKLLTSANVPEDTPIGTTEGGKEFTRAILDNSRHLDVEAARKDNVEAAIRLVQENPDLGAIILECTNMPPYAEDIKSATGLEVYSIVTAVNDMIAQIKHPSKTN